MALFGKLFGKKDGPHHDDSRLEKLDKGELPWGWYEAKADFIKPRDAKLYDLSIRASKATTIDEEITLLNTFISYYYEYQNECFSKGECYSKYFSDLHMHCHNSRNKDFEFVTPAEERLRYIQSNYDKLIQEEQIETENEIKKKTLLKGMNLEESLRTMIINQKGILQSDLCKQYDPVLKDDISLILYEWGKDGTIIREKSGRSYKLIWNK